MRALALLLLAGCSLGSDEPTGGDPDPSLFRDFLSDGKFDQLGHPINATTFEAQSICHGTRLSRSVLVARGEACRAPLEPRAFGNLTLNARVRATPSRSGDVITLSIVSGDATLATRTFTRSQLRSGWINVPLAFDFSQGQSAELVVTSAGNGRLEIDYLELFASRFELVADPGSKEYLPSDQLIFESAIGAPGVTVTVDGVDVTAKLHSLLASGVAKQQTSSFRRVITVPVGKLIGTLHPSSQIFARAGTEVVRVEVRGALPACEFEGDPDGKRVLLTGFQPFPADATHENVSWVGVASLDPLAVSGAQIMRLQLPVEYDRAAAEVVSAIRRCQPDLVVSFGQGSVTINLEETAYNLKDTAEIAGGVPDNRGIVFAGQAIDDAASDTRSTRLPLDAIDAALVTLGESPRRSDDPGRYICNNVFFAGVGAAESLGIRAGFVHLPYEEEFPDATRERYGRVVETVVRAALP
jgi:pyroglutamyl-peptidase